MKFVINYQEIISKQNSVTIDVEVEEDGMFIADRLYDASESWNHPDDIFDALIKFGITKIHKTTVGAKERKYEIVDAHV